MEKYLTDNKLKTEVERLLGIKSGSSEKDTIKRVPVLDDYLSSMLDYFSGSQPENQEKINVDAFDNSFQKSLKRVNGEIEII